TQKQVVKSEYGVGVGKAEELRELVEENGSKTIIIDESITSSQANKLATATHVQVIDRERLILNIFSRRATTAEAKLQVQLAELRYELPRARDTVKNSLKGEQAGFSGMGEFAVDVAFRDLKRRMSFVKKKLEKSRTTRQVQTVQRKKLNVPFVSLAGYTSSGKTTLFNRLASESKEESPKLFTTLATTTRLVGFTNSRRKVMLSDTVGFISRLPTYLVESFRSTLDELTYADLVLLMVDASEPFDSVRVKLASCRETLDELEVDPKKVLVVLNKIDLLKSRMPDGIEKDPLLKDFSTVRISAVRGDGLHQLRNRILERTYPPKGKTSTLTRAEATGAL
ncbi:MAG TPA: GTPase HflX, partial [Nitrososphaerales archaeon]|nr:GTPase HflX [Nitrososphaerales archaeon]